MSGSSRSATHHHHTRPLDALAAGVAVLLCLSWGFNQVATKLAIHDIPPLVQAAIRSTGAGIIITLWCKARGLPLFARDGTLVAGVAVGLCFSIEFTLIYQGLAYTTATRAVLFLYLAPFFVVLGARIFLPVDRFNASQWLGLGLSFVGMLLAFGMPTPALDPSQAIGDVMLVCAALFWAATTILTKATKLVTISAEKVMLYQLASSAPVLTLEAFISGHLPNRLGRQRHLRALVRAGGALFRQSALRLHLFDTAVRSGRRPSGAG